MLPATNLFFERIDQGHWYPFCFWPAAPDFRGPTTWLIVDGQAGNAQYRGQQHMVVLASPNDGNYSQFMKGRSVLQTNSPVYELLTALCCFLLYVTSHATQPPKACLCGMWRAGLIERVLVFHTVVSPLFTALGLVNTAGLMHASQASTTYIMPHAVRCRENRADKESPDSVIDM